jgi:uncharacterized delta-60 repeat protein
VGSRVRFRYVTQFAATVVLAAVLASGVTAAGGGLDPSFGNGGFVVVDGVRSCLPGEGECSVGIGMAIQPDGAIVAAGGTLESDCRSRFAVVRLREGSLDRQFGHDGRVLTRFGSNSAVANDAVVAADGRIVVAGELQGGPEPSCRTGPGAHIHLGVGKGFALARYNADGRLDASFGGDGKVVTEFGEGSTIDLLLQPDGKVVAVGVSAGEIALARYRRDGRLDGSFGRGGRVVSDFGSRGGDTPGRAALDRAGRILVPRSPGCRPCSASVVRYTRDGRLDLTFGGEGYVDLPLRAATAVRVTGRRILVAGMQDDRFAVARLSSAGGLDRSFGRNGIALLPTPDRAWVNDLAIQKNGKLVVLGMPWVGSVDFALARLLPNGPVDRSFGSGGAATVDLDLGFDGSGQALAIQRDGKLLVAGVAGARGEALTLARQLPGTCLVPAVLGRTLAEARKLLAAGNCRPGRPRTAFSTRVPKGRVLGQSARPGRTLADYAYVSVVISGGPRSA